MSQEWSCPKCGAPFRTDFLRCPVDGALLDPVEAADPLIGTIQAGRYRILGPIGQGGSGRVYRAEHVETGRPLAVKVLFGDVAAGEKMRKRFRREATSASKLDHPGVVEVIDLVETGALMMIVLGLVEGEDLARRVATLGPLEPREVARIGGAICDALAHAHARGVIHRDLKPENVLLDVNGAVRLVDFGLALPMGPSEEKLTEHGTMIGTPAFVSPEQLTGQFIDERSDLYALGSLLWFLLVGRPPFRGSVLDVVQHVLATVPNPVAEEVPWTIPSSLATTVDQLLAKRRQDRPRSAIEVGALLASAEADANAERVSPAPDVRSSLSSGLLSRSAVPSTSSPPPPHREDRASPPRYPVEATSRSRRGGSPSPTSSRSTFSSWFLSARPNPAASAFEAEAARSGPVHRQRSLYWGFLAALLALGVAAWLGMGGLRADSWPTDGSSPPPAPTVAPEGIAGSESIDLEGESEPIGSPEGSDRAAIADPAERPPRSSSPSAPAWGDPPVAASSRGGANPPAARERAVVTRAVESRRSRPRRSPPREISTEDLIRLHRRVGAAIDALPEPRPDLRARYLDLPLQRALRNETAREEMMTELAAILAAARP